MAQEKPNKIRVEIKIENYGEAKKGSSCFGYKVTNNVPGSRESDYQISATLIGGSSYLIEEKYWPGSPFPFERLGIAKGGWRGAERILSDKAKQVANRALENVVVEIKDIAEEFLLARRKFLKEQRKLKDKETT